MQRPQQISEPLIQQAQGHGPAPKDASGGFGFEIRRRMLVGVLGLLALQAAVVFASGWAVLVVWNSRYPEWTAGATVLLLTAIGLCCAYAALRTIKSAAKIEEQAEVFPRSITMRALVDPRYEWLRVASVAAVTLLVRRMRSPRPHELPRR